ncbi:MAG TPA: alpha/beta hydrolase [Nevskiaceae bacterium]|nr:alpha/beta hydrolase [Nevskiaceae bacterium]
MKPPSSWRWRLLIRVSNGLRKLGLFPAYDTMVKWPVARRKAIAPAPWMTYPPPASVRMSRETIESRGGPLQLKWFRTAPSQAPSILFIHGGGWVMGGADALDYLCANLCERLGVGVVAVDYRLAPEDRFPAGLEDCYDALNWVAARAPGPVAVIGDSAGGNLTAAVCLLARERGGPKVAHQTIIYPILDATLASESMTTHQQYGATRDDMATVVRLYVGDHDRRDPLVSPILAPDHRGLPPAFIITADCDLLRDDGARYAQCLRKAGVPVRYKNYLEATHAFLSHPKLGYAGAEALDDIIEEMRPYLSRQA